MKNNLKYRKKLAKTIIVMIIFVSLFSCKTKTKTEKPPNDLKSTSKSFIKKGEDKWYVGGTLHRSKIYDWKLASERNKLATCGDFLATSYGHMSLGEIKLIAENLKRCIDEACKGHKEMDQTSVAEAASMCLILMENL